MNRKSIFPAATGVVAPGFERVFRVFSDSFAKGIDKGASFAAYYKGKPVVSIWGGFADEQVKRPWKEDTMGFFHSTTKFVSTITIAHMVERGILDYNEKIAKYWPEFAQKGKESITLEMLLSYRSGLAVLSENFEVSWIRDNPKLLRDALLKQEPLWPPGTGYGYHPMTVGLYLDEIVRRTDVKARNLSTYFKEEIAEPFGIDVYIGLPKQLQYRVARFEPQARPWDLINQKLENFKGDVKIFRLSLTQPRDWDTWRKPNDPDFLELQSPSSHGVGTAKGLAKLAGILANGGEYEGRVLLSPSSVAKLQEPLSHGIDLTLPGSDINGRGTWLLPVVEGNQTWFMFGHAGFGDHCTMADSRYKVGWAYITNYLDPKVSYTMQNKWRPLIQALFECVHQLEGVSVDRKLLYSYEQLQREREHIKRSSKL